MRCCTPSAVSCGRAACTKRPRGATLEVAGITKMLKGGFAPFTEAVDLSAWPTAADLFERIVVTASQFAQMTVVDLLNAHGLSPPGSVRDLERTAARVAATRPDAFFILVDRGSEKIRDGIRFGAPLWLPGELPNALPPNVVYLCAFAPHVVKIKGDKRAFDLGNPASAGHGLCEIDDYIVNVFLALLDATRRPGVALTVVTEDERIRTSLVPACIGATFFAVGVLGALVFSREINPAVMTPFLALLTRNHRQGSLDAVSAIPGLSRSAAGSSSSSSFIAAKPARENLRRVAAETARAEVEGERAEWAAILAKQAATLAEEMGLPDDINSEDERANWARLFYIRRGHTYFLQDAIPQAVDIALKAKGVDPETKDGSNAKKVLLRALRTARSDQL